MSCEHKSKPKMLAHRSIILQCDCEKFGVRTIFHIKKKGSIEDEHVNEALKK